jgi:hypothetical protein
MRTSLTFSPLMVRAKIWASSVLGLFQGARHADAAGLAPAAAQNL